MHQGFEIPGIQRQPQPAVENSAGAASVLVTMSPTHFLDHIHTPPAVAQPRLFLDQPHFLPPQTRLSHHHYSSPPPAYFPAANFKLGLNNDCSRNDEYDNKNSCVNGEANGGALCEISEARQCSLGMLHCWPNQQDSHNIKPPPSFWEQHLEASNENGELVESRASRLDAKDGTHFDELEAIYKSVGATEADQTRPCEDTSAARAVAAKRKRRKRRRAAGDGPIMAEFFCDLVRLVVDRQESMLRQVAEVLERVEEERAAREADRRRQAAERRGQQAEARAREKALARNREAAIVSFLERIAGERVGSCSEFLAAESNVATGHPAGRGGH